MKLNKLIPEFSVSSLEKSLDFYVKTLGFKIEYERPEEKFAFISLQGTQIMLEEGLHSRFNPARMQYPLGRGVNFQIIVKDIDAPLRQLKKNNYPIKVPPEEKWYRKGKNKIGVRQFLVQDPDGYLLRFQEGIGSKKA